MVDFGASARLKLNDELRAAVEEAAGLDDAALYQEDFVLVAGNVGLGAWAGGRFDESTRRREAGEGGEPPESLMSPAGCGGEDQEECGGEG